MRLIEIAAAAAAGFNRGSSAPIIGPVMVRRFALAALAAGLLALPAGALHAQAGGPVLAGYWDYRVKILGLTVDTQRWCVDQDKVEDFFSGPCNSHHTCVYPTREVANGKAHFKGYWQNKSGERAYVEATGTYAPDHFTLRTKATKGTNGVPIPATTIEAKWLGATCQPGAKRPK
jgi:hypothetical protein